MATDPSTPCFPACLREADNQTDHEMTATTPDRDVTELGLVRPGRRSRVPSAAEDGNQGPTIDLEDVGADVLSPTADGPPKSIVVDYDEGVPERSRTALLLDPTTVPTAADCAPSACQPLDDASLTTIASLLEDVKVGGDAGHDGERRRRRSRRESSDTGQLGSPSLPQATLTSSRRGKSSVVAATTPTAKARVRSTPAQDDDRGASKHDENLRCSRVHKLCLCEVKQHVTRESCWLVANGAVYDVTGVLSSHPAGPRSILRKAGGTDCTQDMKFHSKSARRLLEKCFIGKLAPCGEEPEDGGCGGANGGACTIM